VNRYQLLYRLGFAPWERRDVERSWQRLLEGPGAPSPARALDVGCGSGRDAVYLAQRGWQVTAVDFVDAALESARRRADDASVQVRWVQGDVAQLGRLGLEPGYELLYDFGCMHGLSDEDRQAEARALRDLAAPGATLLVGAFMRGRRLVLPRGIDEPQLLALLGDAWELQQSSSEVSEGMPAPVRRAEPTLYRLTLRV